MFSRRVLEADLLNHCVLRCANCAAASPYLPHRVYDLGQYEKDIRALSKAIHLTQLRLLGGEPFLLSNLSDYVRVARESGLCDDVSVTTNGILLEKIDPDLLTSFDWILVSVYPNLKSSLREQVAKGVEKLLALKGTGRLREVLTKNIDEFRAFELDCRIGDPVLVKRIWDDCWQKDRCSAIRDGYVYRCTAGERRALYLAAVGCVDARYLLDPRTDGCAVHEPDLEGRLTAYFERTEPIEACHYCMGCSSKMVPHRQMAPEEVANHRHPINLDVLQMLGDVSDVEVIRAPRNDVDFSDEDLLY